jgi:Citrate lyase beta subunit
MIIRSWLFVPGDSERKLAKGRGNSADALILDLEDAVSDDRQDQAREMTCAFLKDNPDRSRQKLWVRVNPLDHGFSLPDLAAVMPGAPDGIVLPKVYSAAEVNRMADFLLALEAREGLGLGSTKILSVATETAASLLTFHTYFGQCHQSSDGAHMGRRRPGCGLGRQRQSAFPTSGDYDDPYLYG